MEEAIAAALEVRPAEAATILRHLSLSGPGRQLATLDEVSRAKALEAVQQRLTPFARELVNSLQFYQTQEGSLGIGDILLTGGASQLEGLGDALHAMIGVNVTVGDPLSRVIPAKTFDSSIESALGSLAIPIGLAIEDLPTRTVNLLPRRVGLHQPALDAPGGRRADRGRRAPRGDGRPLHGRAREGGRQAGPAR